MTQVDVRRIAAELDRAAVVADPDLPDEVFSGLEEITGRPLGEKEDTGPVIHVGPDVPEHLRGERLLWAHSTTAGVDRMLRTVSPWPAGALLTRTVGRMGERIGQYVLAWALAECQDIPGFLHRHTARTWEHVTTEPIDDTHAVIFGTGGIGAAVATALQRCGVRTTGVARTPRETAGFDQVVALDGAELHALLAEARWVVNALPLTPATTGLFDRPLLSALNGATFFNVGRGASVDTAALSEALHAGHVRSAVLDVVPTEPAPPTDPAWDLPRTTLTSHTSGITTATDILTDFHTAWTTLHTTHLPPRTVHLDAGY